MSLKAYFVNASGLGVLATADKQGRPDLAVYARPHVLDGGQVAFIMADRLSHANLAENPFATYLFKEDGPGYSGKRLYLKKVRETEDRVKIASLRRRCPTSCGVEEGKKSFLVYFKVEKELPLVGASAGKPLKACPTCQEQAPAGGHLCVPVKKKDTLCNWCGSMIPDQRHMCDEKIRELAYICNSCGRTAVREEHLCRPRRIK
jgi:hypothetical protein